MLLTTSKYKATCSLNLSGLTQTSTVCSQVVCGNGVSR